MSLPASEPVPQPSSSPRVVGMKVFVRGIAIRAQIGVHPHEHGRDQPLVVDIELDVAAAGAERLGDTVNYETLVEAARRLAGEGHVQLVETYAERLAAACLADPRVSRARVRVEKPEALAPDAAAAGVEVTAVRG